ncbi:hypothetical protein [Zunongwangia endophytica]|uniref:Uncharacterized protein n=1 Tax=Zunongwangia endophytica TaxID=1808945 RepID=A0ABV8HA85_9FLAO|nr:hypothetical protein [Zunongwangia endophytica]MDN3594685.1 hypothetical protein [Zunongwangia endophytica]
MINASGYFLRLGNSRYNLLKSYVGNEFAEPVVKFRYPRNVELICYIINENDVITHYGIGKKGLSAGTDLQKLNIRDIRKVDQPIKKQDILELCNSRHKKYIRNQFKKGGVLAIKSSDNFLSVFIDLNPDSAEYLKKYLIERRERISKLSINKKEVLATQKEALLTAMSIADIDRNQISGWDFNEEEDISSYLDGLNKMSLREDNMIINDLNNFPGFDAKKSTQYSSTVFKNQNTKLTVLLANRMPLEEILGTDLIYYNENYKCFILVQYKVMEREGDNFLFLINNTQFEDEVKRMYSIQSKIKNSEGKNSSDDFRINDDPFLLKLCPRIEFDPDDIGLCNGMYIPLSYYDVLKEDERIIGINGGKCISYLNVNRYFNYTSFKAVVEGGWIGTKFKPIGNN